MISFYFIKGKQMLSLTKCRGRDAEQMNAGAVAELSQDVFLSLSKTLCDLLSKWEWHVWITPLFHSIPAIVWSCSSSVTWGGRGGGGHWYKRSICSLSSLHTALLQPLLRDFSGKACPIFSASSPELNWL